jgi:hypothetical protein
MKSGDKNKISKLINLYLKKIDIKTKDQIENELKIILQLCEIGIKINQIEEMANKAEEETVNTPTFKNVNNAETLIMKNFLKKVKKTK